MFLKFEVYEKSASLIPMRLCKSSSVHTCVTSCKFKERGEIHKHRTFQTLARALTMAKEPSN